MFGEKKTENNIINIHINNSQICQKDEVKYPGIVIDKNLKWKPHIDKLTTQISQSVGMLYHLKKYLSFNNLKLVPCTYKKQIAIRHSSVGKCKSISTKKP